MKVTAGLYIGKEGRMYLDVYNYHPNIHVMLPPELRRATKKYVEHFSYQKGGRNGGGCVFEFKKEVNPQEYMQNINLRKIFRLTDRKCEVEVIRNPLENTSFRLGELRDAAKKYNIKYEIASRSAKVRRELKIFTEADVEFFCQRQTAKKPQGSRLDYVDEIIPVTEIKEINPPNGRILSAGKQEFTPPCVYEANIDFGGDCYTNTFPFDLRIIPKIQDGNKIKGLYAYPWGECKICYAGPKHREHPEPGIGNFFRTIYKFDEKQLEEELRGDAQLTTGSNEKLGRPVKNLRFGKRTEAFAPVFKERYIKTLETMAKVGTRGVAVNKFLEFDSYVAELLIKTKSVAPFSIGEDDSELGACEHQRTNERRFEDCIRFHEAGVNAFPYILITAHKGPTKKQEEMIEYIKKKNWFAQILPRRFYRSKDLVREITGQEWDFLKGKSRQESMDFVERECGSYYIVGRNQLSPIIKRMHPYWLALVGDNKGNIRMCHHDDEFTYCGGCFLNGGGISKTKHVKKLILSKKGKHKKKKSPNNLDNNNQKTLF